MNDEHLPDDAELLRQAAQMNEALEADRQFAKEQAERIVNSTDAQYFRWLLKNHSGTDGKRCWIGGVDFGGADVRDAIDAAIEVEAPTRAGTTPTTLQGSAEAPGKPGTETRQE